MSIRTMMTPNVEEETSMRHEREPARREREDEERDNGDDGEGDAVRERVQYALIVMEVPGCV
jgi:hypothetical protein